MANRHKAQKRQTAAEHERKIEKEAGFNRGGTVKLKTGGAVPGFQTGGRLDKRARGGRMGKSPFSSACLK